MVDGTTTVANATGDILDLVASIPLQTPGHPNPNPNPNPNPIPPSPTLPAHLDGSRCNPATHRCCRGACYGAERHFCTEEGSVCAHGEDSCVGRCFTVSNYVCDRVAKRLELRGG
eukprot:EW710190.1.p3 GENE.EW710190.1~~EW710190.1.p3  ORF type:complete len:115 (+),score=16.34 EW710190.1:151-495(+)